MISKNDILKFVRHVHRRGRGIPDRKPMHPKREWLTGLFIFLMVTGVGAVVSMLTFEHYKNIDKRPYTVELSTPTYNSARAKTVLDDFALRRLKYNTLVDGIEFVDLTAVAPNASTSTTTPDLSTTPDITEPTTATTTPVTPEVAP